MLFPPPGTPPSVVVTARTLDPARGEREAANGVTVITVPETRWARVDIKSVSLLPNVLAKQAAREQGAREAWFVDRDGFVTEGASANAWIVTADGKVMTRPVDNAILRGISRTVLLDVLRAHKLVIEERPFTVAQAYAAREAFVTAASQIVLPVIKIDGHTIGRWRSRPGRDGVAAGFSPPCRNLVTLCRTPAPPTPNPRQDLHANRRLPSNDPACWYLGSCWRRARGRAFQQQQKMGLEPATRNGTTAMATERPQNLQDTFLNNVRKNKIPLTIFLVNGVKLQGVVTWFDNFCVLLRRDGHSQLVYKHAISTIMPGHPIQLFEGAEEPLGEDKT